MNKIGIIIMASSFVLQGAAFFMPWLMFFIEPLPGYQLDEIEPMLKFSWVQLIYSSLGLLSLLKCNSVVLYFICFFSSLPIAVVLGMSIFTGFFATTGLFLYGLWITLACYLMQMICSMYFLLIHNKKPGAI